jgi:DNA-binding HxlR family transcriptional regulator
MVLDERPYLPDVLAELRARGWISEVSATDEPKVRYVVTKLGREALAC